MRLFDVELWHLILSVIIHKLTDYHNRPRTTILPIGLMRPHPPFHIWHHI